jgi:hypothetical protein
MLENPYLLGSNRLRRITPIRRTKNLLAVGSAHLCRNRFAGALEQGTKSAAAASVSEVQQA